ncbi:DUF2163 domain-containing protein [Pseudooceanicola aestuarii]|uniref:DUF2163 domain-containing protein n=1 Tax=Pseudooceanicola aestuarii TaxID=2697319 RepID=UPI0013D163CB|nr:DUF2163 domain-containing protein [Pseudooceanicola aestuarii]
MGFDTELARHLATGVTTLCHAWEIRRRDGQVLGFTDHDRDLRFGGVTFHADSGLSAMALQQGTGLAVDNTEASGALSHAALTEADIDAGRLDGAGVTAWLVNWAAPKARQLVFRGTLGEVQRADGAFRAELRGLTEALNQPTGRVFQKPCGAVLGDAACGVDLGDPELTVVAAPVAVEGAQRLVFAGLEAPEGWFARGRVEVRAGPAAGLTGLVQWDRAEPAGRVLTLWTPLPVAPQPGTALRLIAGCDKRFGTCGEKFDNALNFQGFPDIPGDDWLTVLPVQSGETDGGSRRT